jgi:hypothetical protein
VSEGQFALITDLVGIVIGGIAVLVGILVPDSASLWASGWASTLAASGGGRTGLTGLPTRTFLG